MVFGHGGTRDGKSQAFTLTSVLHENYKTSTGHEIKRAVFKSKLSELAGLSETRRKAGLGYPLTFAHSVTTSTGEPEPEPEPPAAEAGQTDFSYLN